MGMEIAFVQDVYPGCNDFFLGEGFNLEEYNWIVSPLEEFKVIKQFDVDWEKAKLSQKNEAWGMVDKLLFRDIDRGNVFRNYYAVFVANGKWKVSLVKKYSLLTSDMQVKCIWFSLRKGKLTEVELGAFKNFKKARRAIREIASSLSFDRLLYSEFEIICEDDPTFKEVWCSKFVRDDKNGKTLYTFVGAGAFFGGD